MTLNSISKLFTKENSILFLIGACLKCRGTLTLDIDELKCMMCGQIYYSERPVPIWVYEGSRKMLTYMKVRELTSQTNRNDN